MGLITKKGVGLGSKVSPAVAPSGGGSEQNPAYRMGPAY